MSEVVYSEDTVRVPEEQSFGGRIDALIACIDEVYAEYHAANGFTFPKPRHVAEYISDKWCKIVTEDLREDGTVSSRSVYCFVARTGFRNKALGWVSAGDIHKAAGWTTPARTARGNIWVRDFNNCLTRHGVVYLR